MKYEFQITLQLDKFFGERFRFQSRSFTVSDCTNPEKAIKECKQWAMDYVVDLQSRVRKREAKTLTEEMMAEFGDEIKKAQKARQERREKTVKSTKL